MTEDYREAATAAGMPHALIDEVIGYWRKKDTQLNQCKAIAEATTPKFWKAAEEHRRYGLMELHNILMMRGSGVYDNYRTAKDKAESENIVKAVDTLQRRLAQQQGNPGAKLTLHTFLMNDKTGRFSKQKTALAGSKNILLFAKGPTVSDMLDYLKTAVENDYAIDEQINDNRRPAYSKDNKDRSELTYLITQLIIWFRPNNAVQVKRPNVPKELIIETAYSLIPNDSDADNVYKSATNSANKEMQREENWNEK